MHLPRTSSPLRKAQELPGSVRHSRSGTVPFDFREWALRPKELAQDRAFERPLPRRAAQYYLQQKPGFES